MLTAYNTLIRKQEDFNMWCRLIIEGNAVYEIDDECLKAKKQGGKRQSPKSGRQNRSDKK